MDIEGRSAVIERCILHVGRDAGLQRARSADKPHRRFAWPACTQRSTCLPAALARGRCKRRPPRTATTRDKRKRTSMCRQARLAVAHTPRPMAITLPSSRTSASGERNLLSWRCAIIRSLFGRCPRSERWIFGPAIPGRRYRITRGISETFPSGAAPSIPCATPCLPRR